MDLLKKKNKINNEKDESVEMLKANTNRVNEMIDILSETKHLDKELDSKQTSLVIYANFIGVCF